MIGENIRKFRKKKKITQKALADEMGVSRQAVCMWEIDKRELKVTTLNKLAKIFNVSIKDLVGEEAGPKGGRPIVRFELAAPQARTVVIKGDFNDWGKTANPLKKGPDGVWSTVLKLAPGKYQYKYIVDGQWITDPSNKNIVRNQFGTENSIKEVVRS